MLRQPSLNRLRPKRPLAVLTERRLLAAALDTEQPVGQVVAEHAGDRDTAPAGVRLQLDRAFLDVPTELDPEQAAGEVHVAGAESLPLAPPQPRVHCRRPHLNPRPAPPRSGRRPRAITTPSPQGELQPPDHPRGLGLILGRSTAIASAITASIRFEVFAQLGRSCWRCGAPATDIEHITPISVGGGDTLANLRPSFARCNRGWR
jgi:hypothetical protein